MDRHTQGAYLLTLVETIEQIEVKECNAMQLNALEKLFSSALAEVKQEIESRGNRDIQFND